MSANNTYVDKFNSENDKHVDIKLFNQLSKSCISVLKEGFEWCFPDKGSRK